MNSTQHWQKIQQNNPDIHNVLKRVATEIYKQAEDFISVSQVDGVDLSQALELGFLTNKNDKIAFFDLEVLYEYLVRHAAGLALTAWEDIETFNRVFGKIESCSFLVEAHHKLGTDVLILLAYEHGKNLINRMAEVANQERIERNSSFWTFYHPFCEVLAQLDFEPTSLADILDSVLQVVANDFARYQIYSAVEKLAARSQENADALFKVLVVLNK